MAAKEISVKKYVVRLSGEEREQLEALIRKGKSAAQRLLKARILLKADVSEAGEGRSDNRIIKALEMRFAHMKRIFRLDRFRLRGLSGVRDEVLLTATAQNLRRMAKLLCHAPPFLARACLA